MVEVRVDSFGGEVADVNPVSVPLGFALVARNVYCPAAGAVKKRPGFTRNVQSQYSGAVSALAYTDDVFVVVDTGINNA